MMVSRRWIEPAVLAGILLVLLVAIVLSGLHIQRLRRLSNAFELESGLWVPTQQEREVGRVRELLWRISLGDPLAVDEYALARDIMVSRFTTAEHSIQHHALAPREAVIQTSLMAELATFQGLEGGQIPDPSTSQLLLPAIDTLARLSRELTNVRRDLSMSTNLAIRGSMVSLQRILVGSVVGLVLLGSGLTIVSRRAMNNNLAMLYAQAQQRAAELEAAHHDLDAATSEVRSRNSELTSTLEVLEQTLAQRQALEQTVQALSLPIIPVATGVLVMPLVGTISSERLDLASSRLLEAIKAERSHIAIIDLTGVSAIDRGAAQSLATLGEAMRLIGCTPAMVGITPASAEALLHSGIDQTLLVTHSTLQQGVEWAVAGRQRHNAAPFPG